MIEQAALRQTATRNALLAIGVGGFIAGTISLLPVCIQVGWVIILSIAGGLIGDKAGEGGPAIYLLGIFLHFLISFSVAAIYYAASRRLLFINKYPLLSGLYFGATVRLVMNYIVLPLSALHATDPIPIKEFWFGLFEKMVLVGLPIAYSVWWFGRLTPTSHPASREQPVN